MGLFPSPTLIKRGFLAMHEALREMSANLEGGIKIDLKEVTQENVVDAMDNIKFNQEKLAVLKDKVKKLEMVIGGSVSNLKEVKQTRSSLLEEKENAFGDLAIKDTKEELLKIKKEIETMSFDLIEGINMIEHKFENKQ